MLLLGELPIEHSIASAPITHAFLIKTLIEKLQKNAGFAFPPTYVGSAEYEKIY